MPFRRFGRPGLLGLAARTAVVAGTASAVGGAVATHQQENAQRREEANAYELEQTIPTSQVPAPSPPGPTDLMSELDRLSALRQQGLLSDQEFTAAKQRLLAP
ncbi:putative oligomerization/nucleic acid binding protein [Curtobacterium sp. PhB130]|uniref:SHOCT domain-containing protein n=1 Tax=unclassified Curtobacterium TaxID=257496 RepID=UPI000F4BD920|nr:MULTISPECIES: SHOCT domain-containing protein [unclassified Curtobacterium]ROS75174.1 putative oligomerization/nucleic acid binding protein [Curtobacterium sp. PhB130]TCK63799.1 putative oligomerization/nucleic acid binding protein [Curtobacterium sp. PhB136]